MIPGCVIHEPTPEIVAPRASRDSDLETSDRRKGLD